MGNWAQDPRKRQRQSRRQLALALNRVAAVQRLLQLQVLSLEFKSLRSKVVSTQGRCAPPAKRQLVRKLPTLKCGQRRLIARLRMRFAWLTRFMRFFHRHRY